MNILLILLLVASLNLTIAQRNCTDMQPNEEFSCSLQKQWGKCDAKWMIEDNYCTQTCGRCDQDFACGLEGSCVYGVCDTSRCAEGNCHARVSNIQGEVLILDYNSLSYHGGPNHPPAVTNPAACCDKCKSTQGCNAWVFCSDEKGCGEGCDEYVESLPDTDSGYLTFTRGNIAPVPFTNFGQFGGCQGKKWPWMMCTMKAVNDVENPDAEESGPMEWVSGVIKPQSGCNEDLSWAVCSSCKGTINMTFCQQCASGVSLNDQLNCKTCTDQVSTPGLQDQCTSCLEAGSSDGCGQCATLSGNVEACFECTLGEEELEAQNGCYSCFEFAVDEATCVSECVKSEQTPVHAKAECGQCYFFQDEPERCVQCLQESLEGPTYCSNCSDEQCFNCLTEFATNVDGREGCSSCRFLQGIAATDCYSCVSDSDIPDFAKKSCGSCSGATNAERQGCYDCLAGIQNGRSASACSSCSRYEDRAPRCYECVTASIAQEGDGGSCWQCASLESVADRTACYSCMEEIGKPADVAEMCHMCFGSWVSNSNTCTTCMSNAANAKEAQDCY